MPHRQEKRTGVISRFFIRPRSVKPAKAKNGDRFPDRRFEFSTGIKPLC